MGVKRSIWFKSLATFLAFIIVIQLLPLSVLAENITQSSASDISKLILMKSSCINHQKKM